MFCQKCGAELRLDAGFCAVCGATIPKPILHQDEDMQPRRGRDTHRQGTSEASSGAAQAAAPRRAPAASLSAPAPLIPTPPTYQAIRHAAQRGGARHLAPIASLQVPTPQAAPRATPPIEEPATREALTQMPGAQHAPFAAPSQPPEQAQPVTAANIPAQGAGIPRQPITIPAASPEMRQPMGALGQPVLMPGQALAAPLAPGSIQPQSNGYHLVGWVMPAAAPSGNGTAAPLGSVPWRATATTGGIHLPADAPNRLALGALMCMFASFFLPWVIIGNSRPTPLTVGWPVVVPLAVIAATGLTILLPERTLYTRFFLALPLALGCFALGSALLIFMMSSAIAVNTVGVGFLGVDIGFAFFTLGACVLASAGYFKLIRELPLLMAGRLRLAPLPGALRGLSTPVPPNGAYPHAAPQAAHNGASHNGAASAGGTVDGDE
jgi:hypothetical protein